MTELNIKIMIPNKGIRLTMGLVLLIVVTACGDAPMPKPRGYFRITMPEKKYQPMPDGYPYRFEYPVYANIEKDKDANAEPYWINVAFPAMKAKVHISYRNIQKNFNTLEEDSHMLAYKHTVKADAINERYFINPDKKVYGVYYEIKGDAASRIQFVVTDSLRHHLRGSLYFNVTPNKDSLAPVVDFVSRDVLHMMETFEWND
ncbi:gliding motility-associated lipoprotein GldD [Breznakibacter xylanolyticus]|uniref:Gliding motility-associated lipoprotein GldD n=2 Tax=Breznakibacter xylanolyticus TaxID=990 RepID=A0A2W7N9K9_9BACT|nr:gliding motility-associated lipoprotein GldD [Breznakibacter xylanolyticus]